MKEEMIENEMIGTEEKELNENKVRVVTDYASIVKDMRIVPVKTKTYTYYQILVNLGLKNIELRIDKDLVDFIDTCAKLGIKGVSKKELVREVNDEKDSKRSFVCVKITLTNGKVFRYFLSRAAESIVDVIFENQKTINNN